MKKGFTILELVIVISVLIILIGIAIPRIKGMQQSGNIVKAKGELQTLQSAMESYYSSATPHAYFASTATPSNGYFDTAVPSIISAPLYDPFAAPSTEYVELTSSNGSYYAFVSVGTNTGGTTTGTTVSPAGTVNVGTGNYCASNGNGC